MQTPFLLTGVTGGLGAKILNDMLHTHNIPASSIIATSRSESRRSQYESQGLQFCVADYNRPDTLIAAFDNVENLLFMSSSERDNTKRNAEHTNVIDAAKAKGVKKVWYVSLAFGGFDDGSKIGFQVAHYETESKLKVSGLDFISLRAGIYADAFPLYLNWYPSSTSILSPEVTPSVSMSKIAWASREDLGEGIATLLAKGLQAYPSIIPQTSKNIILLTGSKCESVVDIANAVSRARGASIPIQYLEPQEWIADSEKDDQGGKPRAWFEARLVVIEGVCSGDAEAVNPALEILLGRRPETGTETVERMVRADPEYTWHQNHVAVRS